MSELNSLTSHIDNARRRFFEANYEEDVAEAALLEKAKEELNEIPEKREQDIQHLRDLIHSGEPSLMCDLSDSFLLKFLRARKFDSERAFNLICQHYRAKAKYPSLYSQYWPSSITGILKNGAATVLPDTDKQGRAIIIIRFDRWDIKEYDADDAIRAVLLSVEAVLQEERFQINGVIFIVDFHGFSLTHLRFLTPNFVYRSVNSVQRWQPCRIKGIYIVKTSTIFNIAYQIVAPFFSSKLRQRMHNLGHNLRDLHRFIAERVIPADLGGTNEDAADAQEEWYSYMMSMENNFRENNKKYGYTRCADSRT